MSFLRFHSVWNIISTHILNLNNYGKEVYKRITFLLFMLMFNKIGISKEVYQELKKLNTAHTIDPDYMRERVDAYFNLYNNGIQDTELLLSKILNHEHLTNDILKEAIQKATTERISVGKGTNIKLQPEFLKEMLQIKRDLDTKIDVVDPTTSLSTKVFPEESVFFDAIRVDKTQLRETLRSFINGETSVELNQQIIDYFIENHTPDIYGTLAYAFTKNEDLIRQMMDKINNNELGSRLTDERKVEIGTNIINNPFISNELRNEAMDLGFVPQKIKSCTPEIRDHLYYMTTEAYFIQQNLNKKQRSEVVEILNNLIDKKILTHEQEADLVELFLNDRRMGKEFSDAREKLTEKILLTTTSPNLLKYCSDFKIFENPNVSSSLAEREFVKLLEDDIKYKQVGKDKHENIMKKLSKIYPLVSNNDTEYSKQFTKDLYSYLVSKKYDITYVDNYLKRIQGTNRMYYCAFSNPYVFTGALYKRLAENPHTSDRILRKISKMREETQTPQTLQIGENIKASVFTALYTLKLKEAGFSPEKIQALSSMFMPETIPADYKTIAHDGKIHLPTLKGSEFLKIKEIIEALRKEPQAKGLEKEIDKYIDEIKNATIENHFFEKHSDLVIEEFVDGKFERFLDIDSLLKMSEEELSELLRDSSVEDAEFFEAALINTLKKQDKETLYSSYKDFNALKNVFKNTKKTLKSNELETVSIQPKTYSDKLFDEAETYDFSSNVGNGLSIEEI